MKSIHLRLRAAVISAALLLFSSSFVATPTTYASSCPQGATLNIVAHEDDDLLFLSPDLLHDVQAGRCVRTVFITAGEAGDGSSYWMQREAGSKAAYAKMAGVSNSWTKSDAGVTGHAIPLFTLNGKTNLSLAFMRLPDGAMDGSGFDTYGNESLQKLWQGDISTITADNGSSSYTRQGLIDTLTSIMTKFQPTQIRAQNFNGDFGDGDHSDHHAAALFAHAAHLNYTGVHTLTAYLGYPDETMKANVSGTDLKNKKAAFYKYATFDGNVCGSDDVACAGSDYILWLARQYTNGSESGGGSTPTPTPTPTPTATPSPSASPSPSPTPGANIAGLATATASSQDTADSQQAIKAIDGIVAGWPGDYTKEWATNGGGAGSWLNLAWTSPHTITKIVLHDRPNLDDQITGATIKFSDGTTLTVPALANDGSAVTLTLPTAKSITTLRLTINSVSTTTYNVGLSEIEVY